MDQAVIDAYVDAQREWSSREPTLGPYPVDRATLLAKRAEWQRWRDEGEAEGLLPGYGPDGFRHWVTKYGFNPAESRIPTGQWTSGSTTTTVTPGRGQQTQARHQRQQAAADARSADQQQGAAAQARIANRDRPKQPKSAAKDAVDRARKELGIPTGKKLKQLPAAKQQAAQQVLAATRTLVSLRGQTASADTHVAAIQRELDAGHLGPTTTARLRRQLDQATAQRSALDERVKAAQRDLAAGKKTWRGH